MPTREIIFRGLDESGKWVTGSLMQSRGETRIIPEPDKENVPERLIWVKPESVQQFTGLYDSANHTPIYENDIVAITDSKSTEVGIVRFDNLKVYVETGNGNKPLYQYNNLRHTRFTVIGNEVTDEDKCLLQRIDNFLETFDDGEYDSEEFPEAGEMYALIRDMQKYLKKQLGADYPK